MEKEFEKKYHEFERIHFWFRARRKNILSKLKAMDKFNNETYLLDVGCSSGVLLGELVDLGFDSNKIYGVDISEEAIEKCKLNGLKNCHVMDAQNIQLEQKFDVIIASDCLEHLEADEKALKNWKSLLKEDGKLIVFVPAFSTLWSEHDEVNFHYRRYTMRGLKKKMKSHGLNVERSGYWNCLLFVPIASVRLLGKLFSFGRKRKNKGNLNKISAFNSVFLRILNFENKLFKKKTLPFGLSVFVVCTKK